MTGGNGDPPVTIKTLYEMVKRLDEKVDDQQVQLAILVREIQKPPSPCPRSQEVYDAVKQAKVAEAVSKDHEKRLVVAERVIAAIVVLWGIALTALGKLLYDLVSGVAQIVWK